MIPLFKGVYTECDRKTGGQTVDIGMLQVAHIVLYITHVFQ